MKSSFKNLAFVFIFGIMTVYCSTAQKTYTVQSWSDTKKPHIGSQLQKMKYALSLSDEQVTKIQNLVKESHAQAKASPVTDTNMRKMQEKERLKALEVSIVGVLNTEQVKKYEVWKVKQKEELKRKKIEKKDLR